MLCLDPIWLAMDPDCWTRESTAWARGRSRSIRTGSWQSSWGGRAEGITCTKWKVYASSSSSFLLLFFFSFFLFSWEGCLCIIYTYLILFHAGELLPFFVYACLHWWYVWGCLQMEVVMYVLCAPLAVAMLKSDQHMFLICGLLTFIGKDLVLWTKLLQVDLSWRQEAHPSKMKLKILMNSHWLGTGLDVCLLAQLNLSKKLKQLRSAQCPVPGGRMLVLILTPMELHSILMRYLFSLHKSFVNSQWKFLVKPEIILFNSLIMDVNMTLLLYCF